jgi:hypothetical protein
MAAVDTVVMTGGKMIYMKAGSKHKEMTMSNNYGWQEFEAKNRSENYRRQAKVQRQLKEGKIDEAESGSLVKKVGFALVVGAVLIVIGFLLSGCQASEVPVAAASPADRTEITMADRIHRQDRLWEYNEAMRTRPTGVSHKETMSMADRIRFQDRLWENNEALRTRPTAVSHKETMSMADRIAFHDLLGR